MLEAGELYARDYQWQNRVSISEMRTHAFC